MRESNIRMNTDHLLVIESAPIGAVDQKKVLILGGGGVTGRLIMDGLLPSQKLAEITVGSRSMSNSRASTTFPDLVKKIGIDLYDEPDALKKLAQFDLVIIAVGPFQTFGNLPHRLCIRAGVDCIDVNDSIGAAMAIYMLDQEAKDRGVRVLTGMGLNPGLTTIMLQSLLKKAPDESYCASLKLFIGGKQEVGYAAAQVISHVLSPRVAVIRQGQFTEVQPNDGYPDRTYLFPGKKDAVQVIHRSTPQCYTLPKNVAFKNLHTMNFSIHFQGFDGWRIRLTKAADWLKRRSSLQPLTSFILRLLERMQHKQSNDSSSIVVAECESSSGNKQMAYCTGMTSYEMTARFTVVIAELLLADYITKSAGVFSIEDNLVDQEVLLEALGKRGIYIHQTH